MKGKFIPVITGVAGIVGIATGVIFKRKIVNCVDRVVGKACEEETIPVTYLSSYGNCVSILIRNTRYDILLEEDFPDYDTRDVVAKIHHINGDLVDILSVNGVTVYDYSVNTHQIEKVANCICKDVTDSSICIGYDGKFYDLLVDFQGENIKEPFVSVVVADGDDIFDILSVEGFPVVDWERREESYAESYDEAVEDYAEDTAEGTASYKETTDEEYQED